MVYLTATHTNKDLMSKNKLNYIHNGKSVLELQDSLKQIDSTVVEKKAVINHLIDSELANDFYIDVIKSYDSSKTKKLNLNRIQYDLEQSLKYNNQFKSFSCKGFSYHFLTDIEFGYNKIYDDINFRVALMPNYELYYPTRVRRYLRRVLINHYKLDGLPSICFSLGKQIQNKCFLYVIQSDLMFRKPSFIRDHFRGWRKVLLNAIINNRDEEIDSFYIPSSKDVLNCCHPFKKPSRVPKMWKIIYDQTADEFGFELTQLSKPQNIQIYKDLPEVIVDKMYELKIN